MLPSGGEPSPRVTAAGTTTNPPRGLGQGRRAPRGRPRRALDAHARPVERRRLGPVACRMRRHGRRWWCRAAVRAAGRQRPQPAAARALHVPPRERRARAGVRRVRLDRRLLRRDGPFMLPFMLPLMLPFIFLFMLLFVLSSDPLPLPFAAASVAASSAVLNAAASAHRRFRVAGVFVGRHRRRRHCLRPPSSCARGRAAVVTKEAFCGRRVTKEACSVRRVRKACSV